MELKNTLEGYTVIEIASILAAPLCGSFLAELGAHVVKVENKTAGGDMTRQWKVAKEKSHSPISAYYAAANMGKEVIQLDLTSSSDRNELDKYIREADIVLCNLKHSAKNKFELSYDNIKNINPGVIYGEVIGYPSSNRPAFDAVLQAETGYMSINGEPGHPPLKMPLAFMDILCAHQLKEGVLSAIIQQRKDNQARQVSVSLYEAAVGALANQASNYLMTGAVPKAIGSTHPNIAPYGEVYFGEDKRPFILAVGSNDQFARLADFVHMSAEQKEKWSTHKKRLSERNELQKVLQKKFDKMERADILEVLKRTGVPSGAVLSIDEVFENRDAQKLVLSEEQEGVLKKGLKQAVFHISK